MTLNPKFNIFKFSSPVKKGNENETNVMPPIISYGVKNYNPTSLL